MDKKIARSSLNKRLKQIATASITIMIVTAVYGYSQNADTGRSQYVNRDTLIISKVKQGAFKNTLSLRAQVHPKTSIYLDITSGGKVEEKLVEQGVFVEKGQPLVRLSNTNLQLDVMGREAQVTEQLNFLRNTQMQMETNRLNLRRDLLEIDLKIDHLVRKVKQSELLVAKGVVAKDHLEELQRDLIYYHARKELTLERQKQENSIREVQVAQLKDSAIMLQTNLEFARNNLENLVIKAPVDGYLSELDVELGESKNMGARLGQIDIPKQYKLMTSLDEFYLNKIQLNMPVIVELADEKLQASVSKIDSQVSQSQFQIEVVLPKSAQGIKRGQNLNLELILGSNKQNLLLLSRGAFFSNSGGNWVYVLDEKGEKAIRRSIQLGKKNEDYYEVLAGLSAGEQVITSSYANFDTAVQLQLQ